MRKNCQNHAIYKIKKWLFLYFRVLAYIYIFSYLDSQTAGKRGERWLWWLFFVTKDGEGVLERFLFFRTAIFLLFETPTLDVFREGKFVRRVFYFRFRCAPVSWRFVFLRMKFLRFFLLLRLILLFGGKREINREWFRYYVCLFVIVCAVKGFNGSYDMIMGLCFRTIERDLSCLGSGWFFRKKFSVEFFSGRSLVKRKFFGIPPISCLLCGRFCWINLFFFLGF